ncbi:hypothetical protein [Pedobacter paludis]|uniref:Uncharacterized protein n=1 Tax=Pedobacter paludis TaxID=2203212 RepID=A0A317F7D3_9SPHI|nr:hypothetical protein [Pedobacter paludis]PWS33869.1 hypothetical protein DF947_04470 [Pedobacter paludis]
MNGLTALYNDLLEKNKAVNNEATALSVGRLQRNEALYNPEMGVVALATDVKNYVKSVFGLSHPQYKQISGISFRAEQ